MPNHHYKLNAKVAGDLFFALESFARRFATSLASLHGVLDSPDAEKLRGKDVALRDQCARLTHCDEVTLVLSIPHDQSLPPIIAKDLEQSYKRDGDIRLAFVDLANHPVSPHQLTRKIDDMLREVRGDVPKGVVVHCESHGHCDDNTALLSTHLGPSAPLFRVTDVSCHCELPGGLPIELKAPYLVGICAASFVHDLYTDTAAAVARLVPDEVANLQAIHREQLFNS